MMASNWPPRQGDQICDAVSIITAVAMVAPRDATDLAVEVAGEAAAVAGPEVLAVCPGRKPAKKGWLSALDAHTKAPYKTDFHRETLRNAQAA